MPYLIFSISRRAPTLFLLLWLVVPAMAAAAAASDEAAMNTGHPMPPLSEREADVLLRKATEAPYTGRYLNNHAAGIWGMFLKAKASRTRIPAIASIPCP